MEPLSSALNNVRLRKHGHEPRSVESGFSNYVSSSVVREADSNRIRAVDILWCDVFTKPDNGTKAKQQLQPVFSECN
ncbi:hypothetical protein BaRGS_00020191 [Batillaria attramentaria]|uniref:Uncharacterized protein n=1 Tax=Batillaria attramentaria TaxID=370345 RepID=A0ABD0KNE0_9CAEN